MLWINIAGLTWLELWQSRAYKSIFTIAVLMPIFAIILASLFMVDIGKVYMDGIAAASQLVAIYFVVFLAVKLLTRDVFDRVCYIILAPPVTRTDYFIGRFVGLILSFLVLLLVLFVSSAIGGYFFIEEKAEFFQSGYTWYTLAQLLFFNFFQYISMIGVLFFIISWSSGDAETMLFTLSFLLFSWLFPPVLKAMQNPDVAEKTPEFVLFILQWIYEVLPHLQGAEISLSLAHGMIINLQTSLFYVFEHSLYGCAFFIIGLLIFKRRDL